MTSTPLTYWDYVKLDTIQSLQSGRQTDCYDEVMFIAVHQHFEFWFAQVIRDLREIIRRFRLTPPEVASGTALLHRCNVEFALATQGFEVMPSGTGPARSRANRQPAPELRPDCTHHCARPVAGA
jgi:tryptophan 2,3-dioxygenase